MLGLVSIIMLFVQHQAWHRGPSFPQAFAAVERTDHHRPGAAAGVRRTKGCAVAAHPRGKAAPPSPSYLRAAAGADLLHDSPKTGSRWAKEGKLPFLKTLGGHRRYPEAEIRDLAEGLREEATA